MPGDENWRIGIDKYVGATGVVFKGRVPNWDLETYLAPGYGYVSLSFRFGNKFADLMLCIRSNQHEVFNTPEYGFKINVPINQFTMWNRCWWKAFADGVEFARYISLVEPAKPNPRFEVWIKKIDRQFQREKAASGRWKDFETYSTAYVKAGLEKRFRWGQDLVDLARSSRKKREKRAAKKEPTRIQGASNFGENAPSLSEKSENGISTSYGETKTTPPNISTRHSTSTSGEE